MQITSVCPVTASAICRARSFASDLCGILSYNDYLKLPTHTVFNIARVGRHWYTSHTVFNVARVGRHWYTLYLTSQGWGDIGIQATHTVFNVARVGRHWYTLYLTSQGWGDIGIQATHTVFNIAKVRGEGQATAVYKPPMLYLN